MSKNLAPIALFAYNRPVHTEKALQSLMQNRLADASELYIFIDGPKDEAGRAVTAQVRAVAEARQWCGNVTIVEQDTNQGLSRSVINGISRLCSSHGKAIALEDDLVLSPSFLQYMNTALDRYQSENSVFQIAAYQFPVSMPEGTDVFFSPLSTSLGWGTWSRVWEQYDINAKGYADIKNDRVLRTRFELEGAFPFYKILERTIRGESDSWAIRFYLTMFLNDGLTLHPRRSLIQNIGMDGSGTNCSDDDPRIDARPVQELPETYPSAIKTDEAAFTAVTDWLREHYGTRSDAPSWLTRQLQALKMIFKG